MYSTYRAPTERSDPDAVTVREIEERLAELNPSWSPEAVQIASVLFAILKEGYSTQKLVGFTRYPSEFLLHHVEILRSRGELFTGTLSNQFVLSQCPGSEDLIERITGQRINRKEKPKMSIAKNGATAPEAVEVGEVSCAKSESCNKPNGHMGRCRGAGFPRKASVKGAKARRRKQANIEGDKTKRSVAQPNGHKLQTATAALVVPPRIDGLFKIEYEDETLTIKIDGAGRQLFVAMTEIIHTSLTGGLNG